MARWGAAGWQVLHATGEKNDLPDSDRGGYVALPYIDRMDFAYALADAIVSRAGSATVSEVSALGIPAIYVPYAVGNGEQALNAASAVRAGAARIISDADLTPERVRDEVIRCWAMKRP